jgi:RHS repeat-associated protein
VHNGIVEVELSEEPNLVTTGAIQIDGATAAWVLGDDRYTLKSANPVAPGSHALAIGTTLADLNGGTLAEAFTANLSVAAHENLAVFEAPDPREIAASTIGNLFGFQGLPIDPETGLIYFRNRYYDVELGRFITVDPKGYTSPSLYAFESNDPANLRDPLGLQAALAQQTVEVVREAANDNQVRLTLLEGGAGVSAAVATSPGWLPVAGVAVVGGGGGAAIGWGLGKIPIPGSNGRNLNALISDTMVAYGESGNLNGALLNVFTGYAIEKSLSTKPTNPANPTAPRHIPVGAPTNTLGKTESDHEKQQSVHDSHGNVVAQTSVPKNSAPPVHEGKQGKHIVGHNNYIAGRSILTADPAELAEKAGTGTPVGNIPRGQPGFKERVDFGKEIGSFVDEHTKQSTPTTKGIIIHDKDGKIHIVPARP